MNFQRVIIIGGFGDEEMIPTLVEGFLSAGLMVDRIPSRGVIEEHRTRDLCFAHKETIAFPTLPAKMPFANEAEFCCEVHDVIANGPPAFVLWWYAKSDRPGGLIEALPCPTVRFSWDDPMAIDVYGEDWSRGFSHAITSCRASIPHYEARGVKAMWTLPPVSPMRHGQAVPTPGEECDICFTFYTLYDGSDVYLRERCKRRELIEAAADLGRVHIYGGWGRRDFKNPPRAAYRGFRTTGELPGIYAAAKIVVSQHPQIDAAGYVSPRDMEAMASGGFLLSDQCDGLAEWYGRQFCGQYSNLDTFVRNIQYWLRHDDERNYIRLAAQQRAIIEYGGKRFAERLLEFIA